MYMGLPLQQVIMVMVTVMMVSTTMIVNLTKVTVVEETLVIVQIVLNALQTYAIRLEIMFVTMKQTGKKHILKDSSVITFSSIFSISYCNS